MAFWKQNKNWILTVLISTPILFLIANLMEKPAKFVGYSAMFASLLLALSLIPGTLGMLHKSLKKNKIIRKLTSMRRDFGVSSGIIFFVHGIVGTYYYLSFPPEGTPPRELLMGVVANYAMLVLLATSPIWVRKKLRQKWNWIHSLAWFIVPLMTFHANLSTLEYSGSLSLAGMFIGVPLLTLGFVKIFFPGSDKKDILRDLISLTLGIMAVFLIYNFA